MDSNIMVLFIFVLSIMLGFEVITKVPPILHTPLMSGANAISGITIIGALLVSGSDSISILFSGKLGSWLALIALIFATINVVGGFLVTDRMLGMFKKGS